MKQSSTSGVTALRYPDNGCDCMEPLTRGKQIARSKRIIHADLTDYIKGFKNKKINPSAKVRMRPEWIARTTREHS